MGLALPDEVADGGVHQHDLAGEDQAAAVRFGKKLLGNNALQHGRELGPDLGLLVMGEGVQNPVHGLGRADGVQGGKDQVSGLRRGEGDVDGFRVPHLAHHDDVRVLPEGGAQSGGEGPGVPSDLALVHEARFVPVKILDGVLDGDDVTAAGAVDDVDHGGEGCGLAAAGGPGGQNQAALLVGEGTDRLGDAQSLKAGNGEGQGAQSHGEAAALLEDIGAEPAETRKGEGKVDLAHVLQDLASGFVHALANQRRRHIRGHDGRVFHNGESGIEPDHGRGTHSNVKVGGLRTMGVSQQLVQALTVNL
ncbi:hypothetical protein SDC9_50864 [bioreactor metagenome]|uniref:Uncharacterized protein n=1 Tax=bioreactor metagenome TaxID=1076179 RepID=A0A644WL29_9ZZZZ